MSAAKPRPHVLIVDDDAAVRISLSQLLDAMDISASTAEGAQDAIEAAAHQTFDCILLDVAMPSMDGMTALKILRRTTPATPVIMITGHGQISMAVDAMKSGADDFLEKPLKDQPLREAILLSIQRRQEAAGVQAEDQDTRARFATLTPREKEIALMVMRGHSTLSVAGNLGISPRTVEHHRASVFAKMKAASVAHLIRMLTRIPDAP